MIPENYLDLLKKLIAKTKAGQAIWSKTSGEDEYKLELEKGAITTDVYSSNIDFRVWDDKGNVIDSLAYSKNSDDSAPLRELHHVAKRSFYNVDSILKDIFNELDTDKVIGKKESNEPDF